MPDRVAAIVLAAGAGSRFGGAKLTAGVDGKPVLQHVLDALDEAGIDDPIVVLGAPIETEMEWRAARPVTNPDPGRGLASSLRVGWEAALATEPPAGAVLILLGDQPLVRADVLRMLAGQSLDPNRPIVAPRYAETGAPNPVRVDVTAADLVAQATGDRGLGPLIEANPDAVRWIGVDGDNPDVDTAADLARVADLAWARRVRRNREQVERFREIPDGTDFYAKVSSIFREDPARTGDVVLEALLDHARPDDTWLDIGAGAGRYALPLAGAVRRVLAIDPSPSMLACLREAAAKHAIDDIDVFEGRWPGALEDESGVAAALPVDVSLIAHVSYDVEDVWPFLAAMERATRRECLAVLMERSPASLAEPFWPELHGERRISLPALPAFVDLLAAHGRGPSVRMLESSRRRWASREELETYLRRQTWVAPGSAKDARLQELIDRWLVIDDEGKASLSVMEPLHVGLVAWSPVDSAA